jgi:predicted nucleotidyltransferase
MQFDAVREVLENFDEVRLAYLFGSVAAGTARPASDLDVAVLLTPGAGPTVVDRLIEALERASSRAVDLVDLSLAPPLLAHEVVRQGKLILSRDEDERVEFETRAVARYLDTAHLRKVQHEYLRKRVEARGAGAR